MRWKLILGNAVTALILAVLAFLTTRGMAADALSTEVDESVQRGVGLFNALRTSEAEQERGIIEAGASRADLRAIFAMGSANDKAAAAHAFANRFARELGQQIPVGRPRDADVVVLVDNTGHVLARNVAPGQDRNRDVRTEFEAVDAALQGATGRTVRDFIKYDQEKYYDMLVVPVLGEDGHVAGLLMVGYEIGDNIAQRDRPRLGLDVGYVIREGSQFLVHSLSFGQQTEKTSLVAWANGADVGLAGVFNGNAAPSLRDVTIAGDTWRVSAAGIAGLYQPRRAGSIRPGVIVLRNLSRVRAPSTGVALPVLVFGILTALVLAVFNFMVANGLLKTIEQIETSLMKVISGDHDHRIQLVHPDLGGIGYNIDQLVSVLTGEESTDDAGRVSNPPPAAKPATKPAQVEPPMIDEGAIANFNASDPAEAALAQKLQSEPENQYYDRLRKEYVAARQAAGLAADGMTHEQFVDSVRASEQMLAQKNALTLVRFVVERYNEQVYLRPIPIR